MVRLIIGEAGRDWYDVLSLLVNLAAVLIATLGGFIALRSYVSTSRFNATNQMHEIFREYLKKKSDIKSLVLQDDVERRRFNDELASYLLYTLEEMFAWVLRERRMMDGIFWRLMSGESAAERRDMINAWEATIMTHLLHEWEYSRASIIDYTACYSVKFIEFVAGVVGDVELASISTCGVYRNRHRLDRAVGLVERQQRGSLKGVDVRHVCCGRYYASCFTSSDYPTEVKRRAVAKDVAGNDRTGPRE